MIAYWLLPAESPRSWFVATIAQLARKYDGPLFEPHVTLYSTDENDEAARTLLERIAALHAPIELSVGGIEHSERFTKTFFVQFANARDAQQLSDAFVAASPSQKNYEFNPHLSLLYAHLPAETKAAEARNIRAPFERALFDSIAAIRFPRPIESRADVELWRTIATAKLAR